MGPAGQARQGGHVVEQARRGAAIRPARGVRPHPQHQQRVGPQQRPHVLGALLPQRIEVPDLTRRELRSRDRVRERQARRAIGARQGHEVLHRRAADERLEVVLDRRREAVRHHIEAVGAGVVRRRVLLPVLHERPARAEAERVDRRQLRRRQPIVPGLNLVRSPRQAAHRPAGACRRHRALVHEDPVAQGLRRHVADDWRFARFLQLLVVGVEEQTVLLHRRAQGRAVNLLVQLRRLVGFARLQLRQLQEVLVGRGRGVAVHPVAGAVKDIAAGLGDE